MFRFEMSVGLAIPKYVLLVVVASITISATLAVGSSEAPEDEDHAIGATSAALSVVRLARSLVDTVSVRTVADISPEDMAASKASVELGLKEIRRQLDVLAGSSQGDAAARMSKLLNELVLKTTELEDGRSRFAQILRDSRNSRQKLIAETSWQLLPAAVASEDDLFHHIISKAGVTEDKAHEAVSVEDLLLYARLALLKQQIDQGYIALEVATRQTDSQFIGTVEENANLAMYQLRVNTIALSNTDHEDIDPTLVPLAGDLVDAAYGESNLIDLMKTRLELDEQEARLAASCNEIAARLQSEAYAVLSNSLAETKLMARERDTAIVMQAALELSQHATAATTRLSDETTAGTQISDLPLERESFNGHISDMRHGLDTLQNAGYHSEVARIRLAVDHIESIAERLFDGRPVLAKALQSAAQERAQLRSFVAYQLEPSVGVSLDNQLYYMLTGRSEFRDEGSSESERLSHSEFLRFWHLALVNESIFRTFSGLIIAIIMTDSTLIGEGEERFITASHRLEKSIEYLEKAGGAEIDAQLVPLARQFIAFGNGESNVFDSLRHRLPLIAHERELIQLNHEVFAGLQLDLEALLDTILRDAASSS